MKRSYFNRFNSFDRRRLVAGFVCALFALLLLLGSLMWSGYREAVDGAVIATRNHASTIESRLDATLRRVESDLRELSNSFPVTVLDKQTAGRNAGPLDQLLDLHMRNFPEVEALRVLDARGDLLYTSARATAPPASGTNRDYLHKLQDDPALDIVYSEVIKTRSTGREIVVIGKALRDRSGVFRGMIYAVLNLEYFKNFFRELNVGEHGNIAIYRSDDFTRVVRWPSSDNAINVPLPPDSPTRAALTPGTRKATLELASATDGELRYYSYCVLERYPFFVSVGIARSDILSSWLLRVWIVGMAVLFLVGILSLLLFLLLRELVVNIEKEAELRSTFDYAAMGIVHIAPDSYLLLKVNPKYCRMLGYTEAELIGMDVRTLVYQQDGLDYRESDRRRLLNGEIETAFREQRYIRKDGTLMRGNRGLSLVRNAEGKPEYFISIIEDIEQRKKDQESRNYLAAIVHGSNEAIVGCSKDRTITSWNAAAERMFGYTTEEIVGQMATVLVPPERMEEIQRHRSLFAAGQPVTGVETERITKDNRRIVVSLNQSYIYNEHGEVAGVALIFRDVTAKIKAQQEIGDLRDRMAAIIDASHDAIISIGEDERIIIFNSMAANLFGLTEADALGQTIDRFIPARFRAGHHAHLRKFSNSGVTVRGMGQFTRISALKADGAEFPIEASISHIAVGGKHIYTVTIRDISDRELSEKQRTSLEEQLRESQKMEAIGTLAGGIAHDFNNIIATILGNASLAAQDTAGNPQAQQSITEINKAGMRARELVRQILSFSRRQATSLKPTALAAVVTESARLLRSTFPARVLVNARIDDGVPNVMADETQIQQVVLNISTNAMQAMQDRSGQIDIRLDTVVLDEALAEKNPRLSTLFKEGRKHLIRLMISDNGSGMDEATRARIFEPFFTTKSVNEGTGLGLSVVHGIVQSHGGAIMVGSTLGKGTTFTIYLPAIHAQAITPDDNIQRGTVIAAPDAVTGQHILYLDDETALVYVVKRLLERRGLRVSGFSHQDKALAALRAAPGDFHLVVTDYNMPGMSGLDVARAVHAIRADLPVAVASGFLDEELRDKADDAWVRELIFKASDVNDFCSAIIKLARPVGSDTGSAG